MCFLRCRALILVTWVMQQNSSQVSDPALSCKPGQHWSKAPEAQYIPFLCHTSFWPMKALVYVLIGCAAFAGQPSNPALGLSHCNGMQVLVAVQYYYQSTQEL